MNFSRPRRPPLPTAQKPGDVGSNFLAGLLLALVGWFVLTVVLPSGLLAIYGDKTAWYFTRATGTVAYLLLSSSTIWGLLLSSKIIKEALPAALALPMHNILSWLAIAMAALHAFALLFDTYYTYKLSDLLLPFIGPYRPGWVGLGVIGFYLAILTSASFSFRKQLGQKWWRRLHYLTFLSYILITIHGIMAGSDSSSPGMKIIYIASSTLILFLINYRIVSARFSVANS